MDATADAPPPVVVINESDVPMNKIQEKLNQLLKGQTVLYRARANNRRPIILFLVDLKNAAGSKDFAFVPTSDGVKIQKIN